MCCQQFHAHPSVPQQTMMLRPDSGREPISIDDDTNDNDNANTNTNATATTTTTSIDQDTACVPPPEKP
jgi:hypothetical protein